MAWIDRLLNTTLRRRASRERIDEEMAFHLEEAERAARAAGIDPEEARQDALRRFGNPLLLRERALDADFLVPLETLFRDLRLAFRSLAKRRGLAATAIASLALGIGANAALFSVVDAVLLRPLPLPQPDRLIVVAEAKNGEPSGGNPPRLADWGSRVPAFQAVAGLYGEGVILTGEGDPVRLEALRTLGQPLAVLGVRPRLGRGFTKEEEAGRGEPVALLGERLWRRRYGADPKVLGRTLHLAGTATAVIGVLPDALGNPEGWDLIVPAPPDVQDAPRRSGFLKTIARLEPGVALAAAQAQLDTVAAGLARQYPDTDAGRSARALPLGEEASGGSRLPLLALLATAGLVLLIACVNVAGLLLARAVERQREAAIRVSLGAGRSGLLRLYLVEAQALALAGGLAGLALAAPFLALLRRLLPADTPRLAAAQLDLRAVAVALAASVLSGLAFGLAPAWAATRSTPAGGLREGGRSGGSRQGLRLRRALVAVQVMLSVVLLIAVGLLAKSLLRLREVPLGCRPDGVLTVSIDFPWDTPSSALKGFRTRALEAFSALPGVRSAGVIDRLPLEGGAQSGAIAVEARTLPRELAERQVSHRAASARALATLGVPLLAGRPQRERSATGPREALVNQTLARLYFPAGDALGQRITFDVAPKPGEAPDWFQVVGIAGDLRMEAGQAAPMPEVFVLPDDTYWPLARFVLRTEGDPQALAPAVRDTVRRLEPGLLIDGLAPLDDQVDLAFADARVRVWLVGSFALVALLLAAIGLYGVLASDVAQRTHEIGVRLALGAGTSRVLLELVRKGTSVAVAGLALGVLLSLGLTRLLAGRLGPLLFRVHPFDPGVVAGAAFILLVTATLATFLPARRASLVELTEVLKGG